MIEARFYDGGDSVRCKLCPHGCVIRDGQAGACKARRNADGVLYAESYGRVSSLALDPIEKKPLRHFYPGSYILSAGSYGCNMSCAFCQNSEISQKLPETRYVSPEELADTAKSTDGNIGIAFTYNEPLVGIEYILDAAPLFKEMGLKVVLVTNGMISPGPLEALLPWVDAMNIDIKSFTAEGYRDLGGDFDTVRHTIERAAALCHVETTALIVPGKNDKTDEMEGLSLWLASLSPEIPLHITRFFPRYKLSDAAPTPVEALTKLAETAKRALKYVYVGNV